jgi:hypothetical protein
MQEIKASQLAGYHRDKKSRRRFLRESFRFGGIGAILFATVVGVAVFSDVSDALKVVLLIVGAAGFGFEYLLHFKAKNRRPVCHQCESPFSIYKNAERSDDIEYFYVCENCKCYFEVLHSTAPGDMT